MTYYNFDTARRTLVSGPRLWGRPESTAESAQEFWRILALIAARALHEVATALVSASNAQNDLDIEAAYASQTEVNFDRADSLCEVIAEDLRPGPNLTAADVRSTLGFLAQAFGLEPGFVAVRPETTGAPSLPDCYEALNLALDGMIPSSYLDRYYDTLGGRCPRCATRPLDHRPARSRVDQTRMICSNCGLHEATLGPNAPGTDQWPLAVPSMLPDLRAEMENPR